MMRKEEGEEGGAKAQPGDPSHMGLQETPLQPQLEEGVALGARTAIAAQVVTLWSPLSLNNNNNNYKK